MNKYQKNISKNTKRIQKQLPDLSYKLARFLSEKLRYEAYTLTNKELEEALECYEYLCRDDMSLTLKEFESKRKAELTYYYFELFHRQKELNKFIEKLLKRPIAFLEDEDRGKGLIMPSLFLKNTLLIAEVEVVNKENEVVEFKDIYHMRDWRI